MISARLKKLFKQKIISNYQIWFDRIADEVINRHSLCLGSKCFEILEVEFYINEPSHPDIFSHGGEDKKQNAVFAFHRMGSSFKEGSYTGLDIAIGNESRFGGMLLRSLRDLQSGEVIEGPSKVVSLILDYFREEKVRDLVKKIPMNLLTSEGKEKLSLVMRENSDGEKLFRSPRVGLTLNKGASGRVTFLAREYRYTSVPQILKKGRHWINASAYIHKDSRIELPVRTIKVFDELKREAKRMKQKCLLIDRNSKISDFVRLYFYLQEIGNSLEG